MSAPPEQHGSAGGPPGLWIAWAILLPLLAIACTVLWLGADAAHILEDTLQHIGVARNLLRGSGLVTDLLFYDVQYAAGVVPAPQTVWPPGMPFGIAAFSLLGVGAETGALLLNGLAFVAAAALMAWALNRVGVAPAIAGLAAGTWSISSSNWMSAAVAASELPYMACMLAASVALLAALRSQHNPIRFLVLAGIAAAGAISMRYLGVVFAATAGGAILAMMPGTRRRRLGAVAAFGAVPAAVALTLIARNLAATGSLSGGQFSVTQGVGPAAAVMRGWWSIVELLGLPREGALATAAQGALLGLLALMILGTLGFMLAGFAGSTSERVEQRRLLAIALGYCGVTALSHLVWAMTTNEGMLDSRYLEPLLPFACIIAAIGANYFYAQFGPGRRIVVSCAVLLCAGYALIQWREWSQPWSGYASVANHAAVSRALATPFGGGTVGTWLATTDGVGPVLGTLEHALHVELDHPVLGLPDARYTNQNWDEQAVSELMRRYRSCVVFFVPRRFALTPERAANLPFLRSLAAGQPPSWLEPLLKSPDVELYGRVDDDRCSAAIITAPSRSE